LPPPQCLQLSTELDAFLGSYDTDYERYKALCSWADSAPEGTLPPAAVRAELARLGHYYGALYAREREQLQEQQAQQERQARMGEPQTSPLEQYRRMYRGELRPEGAATTSSGGGGSSSGGGAGGSSGGGGGGKNRAAAT
jgi:hypothetical protein